MAAQASSTYNQALDLSNSNKFSHIFLDSDIEERCTSDPDHLVQPSRPENRAFVNVFADKVLDSRDECGDLSCSLAQDDLPGLDSFEFHSNGDSTYIDNWCEALGTNFDIPMLEAGDQSFDSFLSPLAVELPVLQEEGPTNIASSNAVPNAGINYQPAPNLPEYSTPGSLSVSNDSLLPAAISDANVPTEDQRWHATLARSRAADRYFLYGVLTTKIFCRPSCASRRPSRKHIRFFDFPKAVEAAKQAKFRPCKRCQPETLGTANSGVLAISQVLRRIIFETFEKRSEAKKEDLKLESLAKSAGLSIFHFHRLFKATTQVTPADFLTACHALALQDALYTHSIGGPRPNPKAVKLSSRWSERTARKALGGLSPEEYANGAKSTSVECCRVSAPAGDLEVAYSRDKKTPKVTVHAVVPSQDLSLPIGDHFRTSKRSEVYTQRLQQCVKELEEKCQDRDVELAADVLSILWRARLWLKLTHDDALG
ncbi:MAG: hypothetical protein ASARMPRED_008264 [Alectoria sarmentosa]|nr:MAG: hypothetical protein ASARMPRED_008264 [Alectoria sarmentosa]